MSNTFDWAVELVSYLSACDADYKMILLRRVNDAALSIRMLSGIEAMLDYLRGRTDGPVRTEG